MQSTMDEKIHNFERTVSFIGISQKVLLWIFNNDCKDKPTNQSFKEYLSSIGWTSTAIKKVFNATQLLQMENDPSCQSFDISLLFRIISKVGKNIAPENNPEWKDVNTVEGMIKQLKDMRNDIFHGPPKLDKLTMDEFVDRCENTIYTLINQVKVRYTLPVDKTNAFRDEIRTVMEKVKLTPRTTDELITKLEDFFKKVICEGVQELILCYKKWSKVQPVFFLDGWDFEIEVDAVFTEMTVSLAGRLEQGGSVSFQDVLCVKDVDIILVEGRAGAGKSTLFKFFLSKWATKDPNTVKGLCNFDLVIFFECRNRTVHSLLELITFLLSDTVKKYSVVNPIKCILDLKLLFLIDGLDEVNTSSLNVVREILDLSQKPNILVMCTSRPSDLKSFYKMKPTTSKVRHLRLDGIPRDMSEVFVERLHKSLTRRSSDTGDTAMLVQYIRRSPENIRPHFQYPLNLTLITVLWIISPDILNRVTTMTTLYKEILDLASEKLCERLKKNSTCEMYSSDDLKLASNMAYKRMCKIAFGDLMEKTYTFEQKSIEDIRQFCSVITCNYTQLTVPYLEVIEAFMGVKHTWTSKTSFAQYSYAHRSLQEHMAAVEICAQLENKDLTVDSIFPTANLDLCVHIIGIMSDYGEQFLHSRGPNFIKFIDSRDNEIASGWWLNFVSEAHGDEVVAKESSTFIPTNSWDIEDGNIRSSSVLLKYVHPSIFRLVIMAHPKHQNHLFSLVERLADTNCLISLLLGYSFWHPKQGNSDNLGKLLTSKSYNLQSFTGHLTDSKIIDLLPQTLQELHIAVCSVEALSSVLRWTKLRELKTLDIHITAGLPLYLLKSIPSGPKTTLFFSGITDEYIVWLVNAAIELLPADGYHGLNILGVISSTDTSGHHTAGGDGLSNSGYKKLLHFLSEALFGAFETKCSLPGQYEKLSINSSSEVVVHPATPMTGAPFNPFLFAARKQHKPLKVKADILIWSSRLTDEDRVELKSIACYSPCKLMRKVPW